jgi:superfamily II DNA or RNA helicase
MSGVELRPYQSQSIDALRAGIASGHRKQVLSAPCGSGKTEIACHMIAEAQHKGSRCMVILDRVVLVDQTSKRLDQYGITHGIMQAGHWRFRPYERIQVCSAQTLEMRGIPSDVQAVFVDEAHCMRKKITEFLESTAAVVVGLTATPFTKGMGRVYSNLVNVTTTNQLIADEYLVPLKIYAAKAIDVAGMKVVAGEWSERDITTRGLEIIGDIVREWQDKTTRHFGGPAKTIVFSATVDHGEALCKEFQAAGFNFQQISYKDGGDDHRRALIDEFRKPDSTIHGLISCEVFTKGFDVPDVMVGVSARPYRKSLSSHMQQIGRVMRCAPGKSFGLWLDHSGNALRFRDDVERVFAEGVNALNDGELDDKVRKEPTEKERNEIKCSCGYMLMASDVCCPGCGKQRIRNSMTSAVPGVMLELGKAKVKPLPAYLADHAGVWSQLCTYSTQRYGADPVKARKFALAKYRDMYNAWPGSDYEASMRVPVSHELGNKLKSDAIRWAKRRKVA